ncbi:MAG: zinc ribbon domain-containing protein [Nocardioides sp.]
MSRSSGSSQQPPLPQSTTTRMVLRVLGFVLVGLGLVFAITGGMDFADEVDTFEGPGFGAILRMAGGGFMVVFGLGALNAGFLGVQTRYVAGETMPTVKQSAAYLSDGEGVLGAGRTVDDEPTAGPFCRSCGVRNDADAKFCDGCGTSLA